MLEDTTSGSGMRAKSSGEAQVARVRGEDRVVGEDVGPQHFVEQPAGERRKSEPRVEEQQVVAEEGGGRDMRLSEPRVQGAAGEQVASGRARCEAGHEMGLGRRRAQAAGAAKGHLGMANAACDFAITLVTASETAKQFTSCGPWGKKKVQFSPF